MALVVDDERWYFSNFLAAISERSRSAITNQLKLGNKPLNDYLRQEMSSASGASNTLIGDAIFEPTFGWKSDGLTLLDLADRLLSRSLVDALDAPPSQYRSDYRLAYDVKPYSHQIESWRLLSQGDPQSVVVTSGTGSGKTECFMVPILDSLTRQAPGGNLGQLTGVQALFLYPLNALINSQRDRLTAWTSGLHGKVRFALYNGNTPDQVKQTVSGANGTEVLDRKTLRRDPPPILMTNSTMLEYMLVRAEDRPIIEASRGKLRWIVLDEAHTYLGSQAAELALLLRRVLHAFGVSPEEVRFVATSATIGDLSGERSAQLSRFLSDVSGVPIDRVHVIAGERRVPELTASSQDAAESPSALMEIEPGVERSNVRYELLSNSPAARTLRSSFVHGGRIKVRSLKELTFLLKDVVRGTEVEREREVLRLLDVMSGTANESGDIFLPLRLHLFHQSFTGVWACVNPSCSEKTQTLLADSEWSFGMVYLKSRDFCGCGATVLEVVKCDDCNVVHLQGEAELGVLRSSRKILIVDEFQLDEEPDEAESEEEDSLDVQLQSRVSNVLVVGENLSHAHFPVGVVGISLEDGGITEPDSGDVNLSVCESSGGGWGCPSCGARLTTKRDPLRPLRVGAPFVLSTVIPALLEFASDGVDPHNHPYRGRRLLSFSDSRQGTARLAARIQQDAERSRVRALVYHSLLEVQGSAGTDELEKAKKELEKVRSVAPELSTVIETMSQRVKQLESPPSVGFVDLAHKLANQGSDMARMRRFYEDHAPETFGSAADESELAKMFLLREFGRRPKRQNNLESMGMVAVVYPKLQAENAVPIEVRDICDLTVEEWRDLLKIVMNFLLRSRGALDIPSAWLDWIGVAYRKRYFVEPGGSPLGPMQSRLSVRPRSQLGALLARVLRYEPDDREFLSISNTILTSVWSRLTALRLLRSGSDGYQLRLEDIAFATTSQGWQCPVTNRFLDVTLRGITPYALDVPLARPAVGKPVEIPHYPEAFGSTSDEQLRVRRARSWLGSNDQLGELRELGIWSDLNDRVVELSPFFLTAEHSAQQESRKLQNYERCFREGDLNVLSCSTTMEMGIDVGGVSIVSLSNVPPHPANYLQRAGRAGRRREGRSAVFTLCRDNPHDQSVFYQPKWAFDHVVTPPRVTLDSRTIIQRHVNAALLGSFFSLLSQESEGLLTHTAGAFFLSEQSVAEKFGLWLRSTTGGLAPSTRSMLATLLQGTGVAQESHEKVCRSAQDSIERVNQEWLEEWRGLDEQESALLANGDKEGDPSLRAVNAAKERLSREFLLRELTARGFLPGYGFPTDIVSFNNLTISDLNRQKNKAHRTGREDNLARARDLPSRDAMSGLREYAPGCTVVIDGVVYESGGISLNWHLPASSHDVKELQNLRRAWRCRRCGSFGTQANALADRTTCTDCKADLLPGDTFKFLIPAGFSSDLWSRPHNDISKRHFLPSEPPLVASSGNWEELLGSQHGRFRRTDRGSVLYLTRGESGRGFDVCLECGRAQSRKDNTGGLDVHKRLRGGKQDCPGTVSGWKIQQGLTLAHSTQTDMFDLQLRHLSGSWLNDQTIATTIAVALRGAMASMLGVQPSEFEVCVNHVRTLDDHLTYSLVVYDRHNAGFARTELPIEELLRRTKNALSCPADCDRACLSCLIDNELRLDIDRLDRLAALDFLSEIWIEALGQAAHTTGSSFEPGPLDQAVLRKSEIQSSTKALLLVGGEERSWKIASAAVLSVAHRLSFSGLSVEVGLSSGEAKALSPENRQLLYGLSTIPGVRLVDTDSSELDWGQITPVLLQKDKSTVRWETNDRRALEPSERWGYSESGFYRIDEAGRLPALPTLELSMFETDDGINDVQQLPVRREIDGSLSDFGKRLWDFVGRESAAFKTLSSAQLEIQSVHYEDRYISSPLVVGLTMSVIRSLKNSGLGVWTDHTTVGIATMSTDKRSNLQNSRLVFQDWSVSKARDEVLRELGRQDGLTVQVKSVQRNRTPHARRLIIRFQSGDPLVLTLDQGFSFWELADNYNQQSAEFNFEASVEKQARRIGELKLNVAGGMFPTVMVVSRTTH